MLFKTCADLDHRMVNKALEVGLPPGPMLPHKLNCRNGNTEHVLCTPPDGPAPPADDAGITTYKGRPPRSYDVCCRADSDALDME